jgi:hypothetical protein
MEIEYQSLKNLVHKIKFEFGEKFSYSGISFILWLCEYQEGETSPAFYIPSSMENWNIYFSTDVVDRRFRKPVLLHEILEAERFIALQKQGLNYEEAGIQAHEIARMYEDKLAKELFDNQIYKKYCTFRKRWENGFEQTQLKPNI